MTLQFTINNHNYWIDQFPDGFAWRTDGDEGAAFATQCEAQQDALRKHTIPSEDNYEKENAASFNYRDYK